MKITILIQQRGKDYTKFINVPNGTILEANSALYTSLKEWFGRQVYEAHKRELERVVSNERSGDVSSG